MRDRLSHPLTVVGLILGLLLLAAWELWETSGLSVSHKVEPTSSVRTAVTKPASSRLAEKLYTVKGQVVAVTPASLQIRVAADKRYETMKFMTMRPLPVKAADKVRVWYTIKDAGPVADSVIRMEEAADSDG